MHAHAHWQYGCHKPGAPPGASRTRPRNRMHAIAGARAQRPGHALRVELGELTLEVWLHARHVAPAALRACLDPPAACSVAPLSSVGFEHEHGVQT